MFDYKLKDNFLNFNFGNKYINLIYNTMLNYFVDATVRFNNQMQVYFRGFI